MKSLIDCPNCDKGWVHVPDGFGCVDWDLCITCNGDGKVEESNAPFTRYKGQIKPIRQENYDG